MARLIFVLAGFGGVGPHSDVLLDSARASAQAESWSFGIALVPGLAA